MVHVSYGAVCVMALLVFASAETEKVQSGECSTAYYGKFRFKTETLGTFDISPTYSDYTFTVSYKCKRDLDIVAGANVTACSGGPGPAPQVSIKPLSGHLQVNVSKRHVPASVTVDLNCRPFLP